MCPELALSHCLEDSLQFTFNSVYIQKRNCEWQCFWSLSGSCLFTYSPLACILCLIFELGWFLPSTVLIPFYFHPVSCLTCRNNLFCLGVYLSFVTHTKWSSALLSIMSALQSLSAGQNGEPSSCSGLKVKLASQDLKLHWPSALRHHRIPVLSWQLSVASALLSHVICYLLPCWIYVHGIMWQGRNSGAWSWCRLFSLTTLVEGRAQQPFLIETIRVPLR